MNRDAIAVAQEALEGTPYSAKPKALLSGGFALVATVPSKTVLGTDRPFVQKIVEGALGRPIEPQELIVRPMQSPRHQAL